MLLWGYANLLGLESLDLFHGTVNDGLKGSTVTGLGLLTEHSNINVIRDGNLPFVALVQWSK
jgi:hypothetical protein